MQLPFYVFCESPAVRVYELNDGRFQLIDPEPVSPFLAGYRYLLVERNLATFLATLEIERVCYEPAVLFNRGTGEELHTHVRLHVGQSFNQSQLLDLPLDGLRLLTMDDQYYFVSPALKAELEGSPFRYLRFTEGLSGFAGGAA
jgi:hypothetical protein